MILHKVVVTLWGNQQPCMIVRQPTYKVVQDCHKVFLPITTLLQGGNKVDFFVWAGKYQDFSSNLRLHTSPR